MARVRAKRRVGVEVQERRMRLLDCGLVPHEIDTPHGSRNREERRGRKQTMKFPRSCGDLKTLKHAITKWTENVGLVTTPMFNLF